MWGGQGEDLGILVIKGGLPSFSIGVGVVVVGCCVVLLGVMCVLPLSFMGVGVVVVGCWVVSLVVRSVGRVVFGVVVLVANRPYVLFNRSILSLQ